MSELIFIIIVIAIIVSKVKAQNQEANRRSTTYINGKPVNNLDKKTATVTYGAGYSRQTQPQYKSGTQPQSSYAKKERLSKSEQDKLKSDILSRAKKNVKENDTDILKQVDKMQHEAAKGAADTPVMSVIQSAAKENIKPAGNPVTPEWEDDCDIIKELNDVMVMGYSGDLEFDRDFVAEGVDMLNRCLEIGM